MDKVKEKDIDIIIITEDLELATLETKLLYKLSVGGKWRTMLLTSINSEKIKKPQKQILGMLRARSMTRYSSP